MADWHNCEHLSAILAVAAVAAAVGLHIRATARFERRASAPSAYVDDIQRSIFAEHAEAKDAEADKCRMLAEKYKIAGYVFVLSAALWVAASTLSQWCDVLFFLGLASLLVPAFVLFTCWPELVSSYRREWDVMHYNKWTQEVLPPWPGLREFFRERSQGVSGQLRITRARTLLIVALREAYDFVMKRGKGQGLGHGGGSADYDFVGWARSLERLTDAIHRSEKIADLSSGQMELVTKAERAADDARRTAEELAASGGSRKLSDYGAVWLQQWQTLDAIATARQALGDKIPAAELDEIRSHLTE